MELITVSKTGQYCETSGLDSPTGDCEAGYFCPNGSQVANPTNNVCPKGELIKSVVLQIQRNSTFFSTKKRFAYLTRLI